MEWEGFQRIFSSKSDKMKNKSEIFSIGIIILFCALLVGIWFKDQKLLATGEEGLILANPTRSLELYSHFWNEVGAGIAVPGVNPMLPLLYLESRVINLGVPVWAFQATIFYLVMLIGSFSIYYLTKELFKGIVRAELEVKLALISTIFYTLNPISLLGVWYRFSLGFMIFYALAPLFFYLFVIGVNNRKNEFIFFAPLITLFFTFAFASPALPLLIWILPFTYSLSLYLLRYSKEDSKSRVYPLIYFILMFVFWILINIWWIFPYVELSRVAFTSEIDPIHAIGTLKANSKDFSLANVIRLIHGGFLYRAEVFGPIYKTPLFLIFSWLIPIVSIFGVFKLKPGRIKFFLAISIVLLLFLVKGTSPPLGGIFLWFFKAIIFLQVYRNPLEKIGMILPIIYAPLFSVGLIYLLAKIHSPKMRGILLTSAIGCLVINSWPFFTGAMVSFRKRDIRVEVPHSFQNANKVVSSRDHIFFSLPQMGGASGRYKWPNGYAGVESSEYLFDYPTIVKFYDANSFFAQLLIGLSYGRMESNVVGLAQVFSADVIVFRKDTDVLAFGERLDALDRSRKMINASNLSKIFDSQEVSLWSLPQEKIVPVIYTPSSIKFGDSSADLISLLENNQFDPKHQVFICTNKDKCKPGPQSKDVLQIKIDTVPERIEVNKISPSIYDIKVEKSRGRFVLVFNNSYHPGWTASIGNKSVPEDKHIIANGYANGFIIDDEGSFSVLLKFAPEEKIQRAYQISFLAMVLGVLVLLGIIIKNKV